MVSLPTALSIVGVAGGPARSSLSMASLVRRAKRRLLHMHYEARVGHIGGCLSCLDTLMVVHHQVLGDDDTFVLSKGHAAGALYVTLWSRGLLSDDDLATFHKDNTLLAGHPIAGWSPHIPFSTGSLGHGVGLSAGVALGLKLRNRPGHVYCLTSDGEWQEGSNWEALIFAVHNGLRNLTILIDANGLQGFGTTAEVASMNVLADKFAPFNVQLAAADGHAPEEILAALKPGAKAPKVVILRTVKGHGVPFMENHVAWHYLPMSGEQYKQALDAVGMP